MSFRTYSQVTGADLSRLADQVAEQRRAVEARLGTVARVLPVMSGKGGVGKSWIAARLALGLAARGSRVAVLDADLNGPTVARMLGALGPVRIDSDGVHPALTESGVRVLSMDLMIPDGAPLSWREPAVERHVWRSALEAGAVREFLSDVAWGETDVLIVDLPPGPDRLLDLAQLVSPPRLGGCIVVTIPSEESRRSVARSMRKAIDAGVPLLGIVENMSGYACGSCGAHGPLFSGSAGAQLAAELGVPLIAKVPFVAAGDAADRALAELAAAVLP